MRLFGTIELDDEDNSYITNISTNSANYTESDIVYYTDKQIADPFSVYDPNEDDWSEDWLPYNCCLAQYDIYCKDGKYYFEGEEPEGSVCGTIITIYKEGNKAKEYFEKL